MRNSWITDEIMGAKLSPCGNFSAKKINNARKEQVWELKNYATDEITYHATFSSCKLAVEKINKEKGK